MPKEQEAHQPLLLKRISKPQVSHRVFSSFPHCILPSVPFHLSCVSRLPGPLPLHNQCSYLNPPQLYPCLQVTHLEGHLLPESQNSRTLQLGQWRGPLNPGSEPSVKVEVQSQRQEVQGDRGVQPVALGLWSHKVMKCQLRGTQRLLDWIN